MPNIRTGPVRARDLRANVKELGFEEGILITIELMLEEYVQDRQTMKQVVEILNDCAGNVLKMMHIGEKMKQELEQLKRDRQGGDAIDHNG